MRTENTGLIKGKKWIFGRSKKNVNDASLMIEGLTHVCCLRKLLNGSFDLSVTSSTVDGFCPKHDIKARQPARWREKGDTVELIMTFTPFFFSQTLASSVLHQISELLCIKSILAATKPSDWKQLEGPHHSRFVYGDKIRSRKASLVWSYQKRRIL